MVIYFIPNSFAYMDDFHSAQLAHRMEYYGPYRRSMPQNQVRLLRFWDALSIPHSDEQQLHGVQLVVIGFLVDTCRMHVTIPDEARTKFFGQPPPLDCEIQTRDTQSLAGYINWVFNIFPLLKPALCNVYVKMEKKSQPNALILSAKQSAATWFGLQIML
ncbi:hypothetical protein C8R43DRAFT_910311 [Mycena crocata]|nr:hypothetical protein C8R43DRAFT_910311 [Mycena crocata]